MSHNNSAPNTRMVTGTEAIRLRPRMYVGSTAYDGLIFYMAESVAMLLRASSGATWLVISQSGAGFVIESDGAVPIEEVEGDKIRVFEFHPIGDGCHEIGEAVVLNALSEYLEVCSSASGAVHRLRYERGVRKTYEKGEGVETRTRLAFAPDASIFESTVLSPVVIESFLRRLSFLHPEVRFRYLRAAETREYHAPGGIAELFSALTAPVQLVSPPIRIKAAERSLGLDLIFAYHSWNSNTLCCFINTYMAVGGGTHEEGLADALKELAPRLGVKPSGCGGYNGVVAVMSVVYPEPAKEGCQRERIASSELRELVSRLVVEGVLDHVSARPDLARELKRIRVLPHPESSFF